MPEVTQLGQEVFDIILDKEPTSKRLWLSLLTATAATGRAPRFADFERELMLLGGAEDIPFSPDHEKFDALKVEALRYIFRTLLTRFLANFEEESSRPGLFIMLRRINERFGLKLCFPDDAAPMAN